MNDTLIVTAFVITDDLMHALGHRSHPLARVGDAEVVTVAVAAAACFQNHQERALCIMRGMGYLSGTLSVSRFNRRAHALAAWLLLLLDALGVLCAHGEAFVIDSMPPARLSAGARRAMPQGARAGILRLVRRQKGEVLRLAVAPRLHPGGGAGRLRCIARLPPRLDADPRTDGRVACRGVGLRGQSVQ